LLTNAKCFEIFSIIGEKDCPLLYLISSFCLCRKSCVNIFQMLRTIDEHGQTGENIKTGRNHLLNAKKNSISISGSRSSDDV
jgi:hypothetical protein